MSNATEIPEKWSGAIILATLRVAQLFVPVQTSAGDDKDEQWQAPIGRIMTGLLVVFRGCVELSLLLIRPIGSRRPPDVFVMEPTDAWHLHHPALARRLHAPRLRRVLGEG